MNEQFHMPTRATKSQMFWWKHDVYIVRGLAIVVFVALVAIMVMGYAYQPVVQVPNGQTEAEAETFRVGEEIHPISELPQYEWPYFGHGTETVATKGHYDREETPEELFAKEAAASAKE